MGIAREMRELTQDIASSHEERTRRLGEILGETKQMKGKVRDLMCGFGTSRRQLRAELKEASVAWQELASARAKNKRKED